MTGVPRAPNETGLLSATSARTTAAMGEKPSAVSSGAVIAAGVPKPAAPSRKAPNSQAMITTWARGSGVMRVKPIRMASRAPLAASTLSRAIAPNTIHNIETAITTPSRVAASTSRTGTLQTKRLTVAVTARLSGMALTAGRRSTTSSPSAASSGASAAAMVSNAIASRGRAGAAATDPGGQRLRPPVAHARHGATQSGPAGS